MPKTTEGIVLEQLLLARERGNADDVQLQTLTMARLWAGEQYTRIIATLAHKNHVHENRFILFDALKENQLSDEQRVCIQALGDLVGIDISSAVVLHPVRARSFTWWNAYLELSQLLAVLQG